MFGLFIASLFGTTVRAIKEAREPVIPAENWGNRELIDKDRASGMSDKQFFKNLANGKYKLNECYPEPHRDPDTGKIIIENSQLYKDDVYKYGAYQAQKWVMQGKYNLTPEEIEKEEERIKKHWEYIYSLL